MTSQRRTPPLEAWTRLPLADRRWAVASWVQAGLGAGNATLIGPSATEFHSQGLVPAHALHLAGNAKAIAEAIEALGGTRLGSGFAIVELGLNVEIEPKPVGLHPATYRWDTNPLEVLDLEATIVDRLVAYARWREPDAHEAAIALCFAHRGRLDRNRILALAGRNGVDPVALDLLRQTS